MKKQNQNINVLEAMNEVRQLSFVFSQTSDQIESSAKEVSRIDSEIGNTRDLRTVLSDKKSSLDDKLQAIERLLR